ncbi:MAG: cyclic nucleotide-binding domain-containing protein, partial [Myxococcales bacterium]
LRHRIAVALSRMKGDSPELKVDPRRVQEAIGRRVQAYLYYLPMYHDLQRALPKGSILVRALEARLDQNIEIVFLLLGLIHPHRSMMNVFHRFVGGEPRERAYAVELFDNLVEEESRVLVHPLLESYHRLETGQGEEERAPARLLELVVSRDKVLRACAIYTLRLMAPETAAVLKIQEEDVVSENAIEKVFLLESVDIFAQCDVDDLAALGAIAVERRFAAGSFIFREKDPGEALYVIVNGQVNIEKEGRVVLELRSKDAFGETSLLDGGARPADARAVTDVRLLAIDRQDFLDLVSDRPELLKSLFAVMTRHLRSLLGEPDLVRDEGEVRAWLYRGPSCLLDVFLEGGDEPRVVLAAARGAGLERVPEDVCLRSLARGRARLPWT